MATYTSGSFLFYDSQIFTGTSPAQSTASILSNPTNSGFVYIVRSFSLSGGSDNWSLSGGWYVSYTLGFTIRSGSNVLFNMNRGFYQDNSGSNASNNSVNYSFSGISGVITANATILTSSLTLYNTVFDPAIYPGQNMHIQYTASSSHSGSLLNTSASWTIVVLRARL